MQIVVLGSAAGGGFPQWNCNGPLSRRARQGDPNARARTQSSIAASSDGRRWVLFNASPDLRQQFTQTPQMHPSEGLRHSPVAAVVLTNADVDHVAGLLTMRERQPFALYAGERVHKVLGANSIFNVLAPDVVQRRTMPLGEPLRLSDSDGEDLGIEVEPFAVPGKIALWLEDASAGAEGNYGSTEGDTIGLKISEPASGAYFFYIPGCAALPEDLAARLKGAPLVLFDGTLWVDDEMIQAGLGQKTGQRMGHMSISGPEGTIAAFESLDVKRKVFIHINNTNPVLIEDSPERAAVEKAGWQVAYDGQEIRL